ncbi:MAG: serine hydrolase domain-containing protein [Candidatus Aquilonibacter sp.]
MMRLALLLLALTAGTQTRVDAVFKAYDSVRTPGCALGIFRDGVTAYARGYGMADLERDVHITPESVFEVGSTSKQFAAAAIALLVHDGKLSFSDDVRRYIPELPVYGKPITLNELMWHTSGLRDYTDLLELAGYGLEQATTDEQALALIVRQKSLEFPSGTRYEYSNTNYFLLSVIVKRVSGQTLAAFVQRRIFAPLGMMHTLYRTDYAMLIPNRAMGYAPAAGGDFKNSMSNWQQTGDGGVQISVQDALKWDENFYHPRVGGPWLVDQLQTTGHLANGKRLGYARGLFIGTYRGLRFVSHGGAWIGYRAAFDRYPSLHTSIVVFCNSDAAPAEALAKSVADVVLQSHLAPVATAPPARAKSEISTQGLSGAYIDEAGGDVFHVVSSKGGIALVLSGNTYALAPVGPSSFRVGSTLVRFDVAKDGSATAMHVGSGDDEVIAQRFTPVTPAPEQLAGVAGTYYSPELDVTWTLGVSAGSVRLEPTRNLPDGAAGKLHPQMSDTFTSDGGGFLIRFTRDSAGAIDGFALSAGRGLRSLVFART